MAGAAALVAAAGLSAQTANELSDPRGSVFRAFPAADSYRAIVRDVDRRARLEVERRLPFKVHFNELGPHALYVAFRERKPLGLMYLRAEEGQWGFTEIGWALTLDLRIVGFRFLRGRSQHRLPLEESRFARELFGRGFDDLAALLREDGELALDEDAVPDGGRALAHTVLRSAMKTVLVTEAVWRDELGKLRDLAMGLDAFPAAERFRRQFTHHRTEDAIPRPLESVHVMRAIGKAGAELGIVARTEARHGEHVETLRWILTPDLRVVRIESARPWRGQDLLAACRQLEGRHLLDHCEETAPIAAVAEDLAAVLHRLDDRGRSR